MLEVLGGGVEVIRERLVTDSFIVGTKNVALDPPVESLDRTVYIPQFIWGSGAIGSSPYNGYNPRWELTDKNNLQLVNAGDPAGLFPFILKILEVNRDLAAQVVTANITYSSTPSTNNIPIKPVPDPARALVIPLYEFSRSYDRTNYAYYSLTSASNLQVVAYQYGITSVAVGKFLIVNLF